MKNLIILTTILFTVQFLSPVYAQNEQKPELVVHTGHTSGITSILFSNNDRQIISKDNNTVMIWDVLTGRELKSFLFSNDKNFSRQVQSISPDGNTFALEDHDGNIVLWNLFSRKETKIIFRQPDRIIGSQVFPGRDFPYTDSVVFSPDNKTILGKLNNDIAVWDVETGKQLESFKINCNRDCSINTFFFLPSKKTLAVVTENITDKIWTIKLFETNSQREVKVLTGIINSSDSLIFSPDGKTFVSTNPNKTITFRDLETEKEFFTLESSSPVIFSPKGRFFLAYQGSDLKLFDLLAKRELSVIGQNVDTPGGLNTIKSIIFSPDDKTLASITSTYFFSKSIKIWDTDSGKELRTLPGNNDSVSAIKFSSDGKILASFNHNYLGTEDTMIKLWNVEAGQEIRTLVGHDSGVSSLEFSSKNNFLISGGVDGEVKLWDLSTGQEKQVFTKHSSPWFSYLSPNSKIVVLRNPWASQINDKDKSENSRLKLWNFLFGDELKTLTGYTMDIDAVAFSPDSKIVATSSITNVSEGISTIKLWDTITGNKLTVLEHSGRISSISFSPGSKTLTITDYNNNVRFWDVITDREIVSFLKQNNSKVPPFSFNQDIIKVYAVSNDEKMLASVNYQGTLKIFNLKTGQLLRTIQGIDTGITRLAFSTDDKILASSGYFGYSKTNIVLWSVDTGKVLKSVPVSNEIEISSIVPEFISYEQNSPENTVINGKYYFTMETNGRLNLLESATGKLIVSLFAFDKNKWVVVTPEGRFDTNDLDNSKGLHWILPDAPLTPLSIEVFMRTYYEPKLLQRIYKCLEDGSCEQEFKPLPPIDKINRTQPLVRIVEIKAMDAADLVQVTVEMEDMVSESQKNGQGKPLRSGIFDLRLFRDGQLVGFSTSDIKLQNTFKTYKDFDEELKIWQEANKVELAGGKKTLTFNVKLPKNTDAKEFNFTAYAFNSDRVKSETASQVYTLPKPLPKAKGNVYIVTIGVNANENSGLKLNYAANDARVLQNELAKNLPKDKYQNIVQLPLISDYDKDGNLAENNATKTKIKAVLDTLSGKPVSADVLKDIPNANLLKKVQPEDLVLIAFSGHGYANREGIFYLVPYDIGTKASGGLVSVLQNSISSDELSLWLRDVDAGEMMIIVDACHSAAAVQGKDFKPGPMGSRGLGQLSYDKGMRILTATQANNVALELGNLQHGLLTYSLVKNGIELGLADYQPKDNKLFSNEWLGFAVKDVPQLYEKISNGEIKGLFIDGVKLKDVETINLDGNQKSNLNLQQPSLFDFGRRDKNYEFINLVNRKTSTNN